MKNNFIIVSYYTKDTPYKDVVYDYLLKSLHELKMPCAIREVDNLGSWQANTSYKPKFILEMMNELKSIYDSVVFLDCDATVMKYPKLFEEISEEYDIAGHRLDHDSWYQSNNHIKELLSGTLFLRINDKVKQIVKEWYESAIKSNEWEQKTLAKILENHKEIKLYELPLEYAYIKTLPNGLEPYVKITSPVIVHHQLSRKLKKWLRMQKYIRDV